MCSCCCKSNCSCVDNEERNSRVPQKYSKEPIQVQIFCIKFKFGNYFFRTVKNMKKYGRLDGSDSLCGRNSKIEVHISNL